MVEPSEPLNIKVKIDFIQQLVDKRRGCQDTEFSTKKREEMGPDSKEVKHAKK